MKVLLVNGSPHQEGCTHRALQEVAGALKECGVEAEEYWIGVRPISGCLGCGLCEETGECALRDCVNEFRCLAREADGFVFGSPVHYAGAGGALTAFLARLFYSDQRGDFRLKPAACVVSARRAGTTAALSQLNQFLTINEMPVVSSSYWNMVHGNTPEEVEQDLEGLRTMRVLGRNMAYLLQCLAAGAAAGVARPQEEPPVATNFIR